MADERERIYGRVRVNVDHRTPGIRVAAHPTSAQGDMRSAQVVHASSGKSFNQWAALSNAFGDIVRAATTISDRREREEERARLKAEREAEKAERKAEIAREKAEAKAEREAERQADAIGSWKADLWALEIRDKFSKEIESGELKTYDQMRERLMEETEGIDVFSDPAFTKQAGGRLYPILNDLQSKMMNRNRAEFETSLHNDVSDGLVKTLSSYDLTEPSGREEMLASVSKARDAFRSVGKSDVEIDSFLLSTYERAAANMNIDDPARSREILDMMEKTPGGMERAVTLRRKLDREVLDEEDRAAERTLRREKRENTRSAIEFRRSLKDISDEKLKDTETLLRLKQEELGGAISDDLYLLMENAIAEEKRDRFMVDEQERRVRNEESAETRESFKTRMLRGDFVGDEELLASGITGDDLNTLLMFKGSIEVKQTEQRTAIVKSALEDFSRRLPQEAKFDYSRDKSGRPLFTETERSFYINYIADKVETVRRNAFKEGSLGDGEFEAAQRGAAKAAVDDILNFREEARYTNTQNLDGEQDAHPSPEAAAPSDLIENTPAMESFKKRLLGGPGTIAAARAPSGRPLKTSVNWQFYKSIEDPKKLAIANDVLRMAALEKRVEETESWWSGSPESNWRYQYEKPWMILGKTPDAREAWMWFGMVDNQGWSYETHPEKVPFELEPLELRDIPNEEK